MATTQFVPTENYNPTSDMNSMSRALTGVKKASPVTLDSYFGNGIYARWLYVGTTGDVNIVWEDGTNTIFPNLAAGVVHPFHCICILSSGTSVAANQLFWGY